MSNKALQRDKQLAGMIKSFKSRGESKLKSDKVYTIDSALWYLSSVVNYTYGDANKQFTDLWRDSMIIVIDMNNGLVSESSLYNKYLEVVETLKQQYRAKEYEGRQLISLSVKTQEINSNQIICKATSTFAYNSILPYITFNDFDSWGYWWMDSPGICNGPNSGTHLTSDAAIETQHKIMYLRIGAPGWIEELPNGTGYIWINDPLQYPIDPNAPVSNNRYSHLYWQSNQFTNPAPVTCIPPADLNFYLTKTKELINKDVNSGGLRPVGSSFIDIQMNGSKIVIPPTQIYMHQAHVHYGIIHINYGEPPIPLD